MTDHSIESLKGLSEDIQDCAEAYKTAKDTYNAQASGKAWEELQDELTEYPEAVRKWCQQSTAYIDKNGSTTEFAKLNAVVTEAAAKFRAVQSST
jgi:hypothetical protein